MAENQPPLISTNGHNGDASPSHTARMATRRREKMPARQSPPFMASAPPAMNTPAEEFPQHIPLRIHPCWGNAVSTVPSSMVTSQQLSDNSARGGRQVSSPIAHLPALASVQHRVPSLARVSPITTQGTGYISMQEPVSQQTNITNTQPSDVLPATSTAVTGFLDRLDKLEKDQQETNKKADIHLGALQRPRYFMAEEAELFLRRAHHSVDEATDYYTRLIIWQSSGLAEAYGLQMPRFKWGLQRMDRRAKMAFPRQDPPDEKKRKLAMPRDQLNRYETEEQKLNDRQDDATVASHWNAWVGDTWAEIGDHKHEEINRKLGQAPLPDQLRPNQEKPEMWWFVLGKRSRDYPPEYLASDDEEGVGVEEQPAAKRPRLSAPDSAATSLTAGPSVPLSTASSLSTAPSVPLSTVSSLSASPSIPSSESTSRGGTPETDNDDDVFSHSVSARGNWVNRFTSQLARVASAAIGLHSVDADREDNGEDDGIVGDEADTEAEVASVDGDADVSQSEEDDSNVTEHEQVNAASDEEEDDDDKTVVEDEDEANEVINSITYGEGDSDEEGDDDDDAQRRLARHVVFDWSRKRFEEDSFSNPDEEDLREPQPAPSAGPSSSAQGFINAYAQGRLEEECVEYGKAALKPDVRRSGTAAGAA